MKNKTIKNSTNLAYGGLSVALGGSAAAVILMIALTLYAVITGNEPLNMMGLTVRLEPVVEKTFSLAERGFVFSHLQANLLMFSGTKSMMLLASVIPIIIWLTITFAIYLSRRIIKNVSEGNHFASENLRNMRIIAYLVIIIPHVQVFLENIVIASLPRDLIVNGMKIGKIFYGPVNIFNFSVMPGYIFAGIMFLVFAEVFKVGNKLKQENDLTV
ncbi:MAG: DUF2975 domain-containing protein [Ignavibacteriales bacterium]|nr:DUF2975 domain-containing protein [Ignavibacteriales bacterium]